MARWEVPEQGQEWMTEEILALLKAIQGRHAAKKRTTVIKLAFAQANQQALEPVFAQEDVCNQRIWYQKWQYDPQIVEAFEACYERAMEFADVETAAVEAHYRRVRRRSVARYAAEAPVALAAVMSGADQAGRDRISAADTLMKWAEPGDVRLAALPVEVANPEDFAGMSGDDLDRVIRNLQAATGGGADGATAAEAGAAEPEPGSADVDGGPAEDAGAG